MTLNQKLMNHLKEAMKNKDTVKKAVITLLRAGLTSAEKEKKAPLTDVEETLIVQRELKQTKDSLAEAQKAGRTDIVEAEQAKIEIIESYLPEMMTEEEIIAFLTEKGIKKGAAVGPTMGILMKDKKGKVDSSFAKQVIQKHFA
ncbi:glutamyl-tRNA amidotransferase [Priestia megaterium]|uniref:GatB/YqeY domain-containing protein n=1 Tax=Priestia megaterium TaxID=1404 RepID=UPI000BF49A37|nr:GatB/YqeY domain-containing protein [Priestia megaterium]PFK99835.1 glutamyl-tRNA amidotransferase [Priestia megaterium]